MTGAYDKLPPAFFDGAIARILDLQRESGAIPWFDGGVIDPWNHTEAAMGLAVLGRNVEAENAYRYLAESQNADGSWHAQYGGAVSFATGRYEGTGDEPLVRDTNFCAYPATGIWHHYRITADRSFLETYWPMIERAVAFVLEMQSEHGEVRWAANDPQTPQDDALLTGNASIYKSLECAILIAEELGRDARDWRRARARLGEAIRAKPHRFDRQWEKKSRFSMDWYYPVLSGAVTGTAARARLKSGWNMFVADGAGCRCVRDEPWVTVAESAELALALMRAGDVPSARGMLSWQHQWRAECGAYWMGWQFRENVPWPREKPAWTAAAVILATDALLKLSPAADLFTREFVSESLEQPQRFYRR